MNKVTTKYDNTNWFRLSRTGGAALAILDANGIGNGNGGVSLPCKGCFVQPRFRDPVFITIEGPGAIGPYLPGAAYGQQPMYIQISDVAQLFFRGNAGAIVDIVYLLG